MDVIMYLKSLMGTVRVNSPEHVITEIKRLGVTYRRVIKDVEGRGKPMDFRYGWLCFALYS